MRQQWTPSPWRSGASATRARSSMEALGEAMKVVDASEAIRDAAVAVHGTVRPAKASDLAAVLFPNVQSEAVPGISATSGSTVPAAMRGLALAFALGKGKGETRSGSGPERPSLFSQPPKCMELLESRLQRIASGWNRAVADWRIAHQSPPHLLMRQQGFGLGGVQRLRRGVPWWLPIYVVDIQGQPFTVMTADQPQIERAPDLDTSIPTADRYVIFWPTQDNQPQTLNYQWRNRACAWAPKHLNHLTGILANEAEDGATVPGFVYTISDPRGEAFPPMCPQCNTDNRRARTFPTPLRQHRTGFQCVSQGLPPHCCARCPCSKKERMRASS